MNNWRCNLIAKALKRVQRSEAFRMNKAILLILIGIAGFAGSVGAYEQEVISLTQFIIQTAASITLMIAGKIYI